MHTLDNLLPELKGILLKYLPLSDRKTMRLVNTIWRDEIILPDTLVITDPNDLTKLSLKCPNLVLRCNLDLWCNVPEKPEDWFFEDGGYLKRIHLDLCDDFQKKTLLRTIFDHFNQIESVFIHYCLDNYVSLGMIRTTILDNNPFSYYTDLFDVLLDVLLDCKNLEGFHFSFTPAARQNFSFFKRLASEKALQLKELFIFDLIMFSVQEILEIVEILGPQLTGLGLCRLSPRANIGIGLIFQRIANRFPNLQKLMIDDEDVPLNNEIRKTVYALPLTHARIPLEDLQLVCTNQLQALIINLPVFLNQSEIKLETMPHLTDLRLFAPIGSLENPDPSYYNSIIKNLLQKTPNLHTFELDGNLDSSLVSVVSQLKHLRYFHVGDLNVSDLSELNALTQITHLAVSDFWLDAKNPSGNLCLPDLKLLVFPCYDSELVPRLTDNCASLQYVYIRHPQRVDRCSMPEASFKFYMGKFMLFMHSIFEPREGFVCAIPTDVSAVVGYEPPPEMVDD